MNNHTSTPVKLCPLEKVAEKFASPIVASETLASTAPACPVCGGHLIEIRAKLQCARCHRICETCCEGGRG